MKINGLMELLSCLEKPVLKLEVQFAQSQFEIWSFRSQSFGLAGKVHGSLAM
jgi:hypothetical protein